MSIHIKQLAAYCLDFARLTTGEALKVSDKTSDIKQPVMDVEKLIFEESENDLIILNLLNRLQQSREEDEVFSEEEFNLNTRIANELDTIYRKYETNSYTKQIVLQTGFISFEAVPLTDNDEQNAHMYDCFSEPLFSIPIGIKYTDSMRGRRYEIELKDDSLAVLIERLKKYLPQTSCDEIFSFVAEAEANEKTTLPINDQFLDELWGKIRTLLERVNAQEISISPIFDRCIIGLASKANYFLTQDLSQIVKLDENVLKGTSLGSWSITDNRIIEDDDIKDDGKSDLFFPFPYDKHQLKVLGTVKNKAVIVEGPPGTGKSQTIANLLVHFAASGKLVLFVSQKDQAIRGVKNKLKSLWTSNSDELQYLFGYIPDRTSALHTEMDERDSAAYTLRTRIEDLDANEIDNPRNKLSALSSHQNEFVNSIESARTLYSLLEERRSLTYVSGFINSTISSEQWEVYLNTKNSYMAKYRQVTNYENQNKEFIILKRKLYCHLTISEPNAICNAIKRVIDDFQRIVPDRLGTFSKNIVSIKLMSAIKQATKNIPEEIWRDIEAIVKVQEPKAHRINKLNQLWWYFNNLKDRDDLQNGYLALNTIIKACNLNSIQMEQLERIIKEHGKQQTFIDIAKYKELKSKIDSVERLSANELQQSIKEEKKAYRKNVCDYLRNIIRNRESELRCMQYNNALLAQIARALCLSRKAYKTFDKLKSNPDNFKVMSQLLPIWMMSLDDASRIIPMIPNLFDYVILDESSQCNIAYSLPVMYRAKHAIFFGDTLQMRETTTMFRTNQQLTAIATKHNIPDYLQIKAEEDSVKSVMDIAELAGFKSTMLKNHYRSPKELIGFSNENFYEKVHRRLDVMNDNIFSYENTNRVLLNHVIKHDTSLDISLKTNMSEVIYIKELITKIKGNPHYEGKSIAVLSFFKEQAELLRKEINDKDIKVSIIEGIQGDERDICIYSLVITSPEESNRYNPLTGEGGEIRRGPNEGRVNVAFSRAKLQVHCVTSLPPDLWPENIWIKRYLNYVDNHGLVKRSIISNQVFESEFEKNVFRCLTQRLDSTRYYLVTQVKSCGFRIDLVVTDMNTEKKLAIECDGPTHFEDSDGQIRVSNDWERQFALEVAGWNFYRLSYFDWQENQYATENMLIDYIDEYFGDAPDAEIQEVVERPEDIAIELQEIEKHINEEQMVQDLNKKDDILTNESQHKTDSNFVQLELEIPLPSRQQRTAFTVGDREVNQVLFGEYLRKHIESGEPIKIKYQSTRRGSARQWRSLYISDYNNDSIKARRDQNEQPYTYLRNRVVAFE